MKRERLQVELIEVAGYDTREREVRFNAALDDFQADNPGARILGLEVREGPRERFGDSPMETLHGVLQYMAPVEEPEPEPNREQESIELLYRTNLNKILALASNVVLMREAGKRGEGMDYGKFWGTVDKLGDVFRTMGGGQDGAVLSPPDVGGDDG
jgi:hypothetical protein